MTVQTSERVLVETSEIETGLSRGTAFFTPKRVMAGLRLEIKTDIALPSVTSADVARMKRLNHALIWQPERTIGNQPITMKALHDACDNACHQGGKFLYAVDWYPGEKFYREQTARGGWREVSLTPILNSFGKTFCQQLRVLADYLKTEIWPEGLSEEAQVAISEFETQEHELLALEQKDWPEAAKCEAKLRLGAWLTTPVEQSVMMLVHQKTNGKRFLENVWSRTPIRSSDGALVNSGYFGSSGARVFRSNPSVAVDDVGVCFSAEVK